MLLSNFKNNIGGTHTHTQIIIGDFYPTVQLEKSEWVRALVSLAPMERV